MTAAADNLMEDASQLLARMDYLGCEAKCLEALAAARQAENWTDYARILLPLQECRRQRRMIAADGVTRLGTRGRIDNLDDRAAACIVLTHPHSANDAADLIEATRDRHIEVLFADNEPDAATWTLRSFAGPAVTCDVAAPPAAWIDQWLKPDRVIAGQCPADWFINATEALGDSAIAQADDDIQSLEACLDVVTDHEILHQRLGDAARALARTS